MARCVQISNIIFLDQPTGTGFSYSSDDRDTRHDETGVSNDLYDFLQVLLFYQKKKIPAEVLYFYCFKSM
jgi:carboxypeptidase C (cathepsin A)